ncbi:MAG: tetratricopeptide repeat protein [Candidatus Eisenbacteria bacterium]
MNVRARVLGFPPMWILAFALVVVVSTGVSTAGAETDSTRFGSPEALSHYARGRLLEEQGQIDEALAEYFRAVSRDPRALAPARRASELSARQGALARSLEFAERALTIAPGDSRSLWLRGAALFNLGRGQEALQSLVTAAESDPENLEYWKTLVRVADHEKDLDLLVRASRATVAIDDEDVEAWFQLAGALARRGEFAEADSALRIARAGNPVRPGMDFLGAWIHEGLAEDEAAIEGYGRHIKLHPEDVMTRQRLVALLAQRERWAEAYAQARQVTTIRPQDPEALETEADLAFRTGKSSAALERLQTLQRLDPEDPQLAVRAILVLARNKRGAEGVALAREWSRRHPADHRGALLEARAHALAGAVDRAIERVREAIQQVPDSLGPRLLLGRIAHQEKRWPLAAATWQDILARRPREVGVALDLAFALDQLGEVDAAVAAARDALSWAPTQAASLNFLGYLLADHNRELVQAERLVREAVAQDPDNGAFIDSMGWVYFRLGRLDDARRELEKAALLTRGDPVVLEHLGDVYRDLRLPELARDQYRRSLAADSSNQRVRNKLETLR